VPPERPELARAILAVLATRAPLTARDIALIIRQRADLAGTERRDVNSVLYGELARLVRQDGEFRWSLNGGAHTVPGPDESSSAPLELPGRSTLLRAVHRLRSGLPPCDHIEELTVIAPRTASSIRALLAGTQDHRWLVISGQYGHGKTHTLALVREVAHSLGLATAQISADGYGSALNHPQRFVHLLFRTLELPRGRASGYEHLLEEALLDAEKARVLRDVAGRRLTGWREIDREVLGCLDGLIEKFDDPDAGDERAWLVARITQYLAGHSIVHRAGPLVREMSYVLMLIAQEFLARLGIPRVVLLIDEAESIYTKLAPQARAGAYRVLSALCEAPALGTFSVALAMTPDACHALAADAPWMANEEGGLPDEPVKALGRTLRTGDVLTLQCKTLGPGDRAVLLERVRGLYRRAYPAWNDPAAESTWADRVERAARLDISPRLLIRQAVNVLDGLRYGDGSE
jgi:hypothetical protein